MATYPLKIEGHLDCTLYEPTLYLKGMSDGVEREGRVRPQAELTRNVQGLCQILSTHNKLTM